jgi:hypothetical protein
MPTAGGPAPWSAAGSAPSVADRSGPPATAPAFAAAHGLPSLFIATWEQIRSSDEKELTVVQIVLLVGTCCWGCSPSAASLFSSEEG